jgi:hypothetical protein
MRKDTVDDEAILRGGDPRGNVISRHSAACAGRLWHSRDADSVSRR